MQDLFDILFSRPELLIFVAIALVSTFGRVFKNMTEKAARRASEEQRRAEREPEGQRPELKPTRAERSAVRGEQAPISDGRGSRAPLAKPKPFLMEEGGAGSRSGTESGAAEVRRPRAEPKPQRPGQDQIAAEIRRMMGLEEPPQPTTQLSPPPVVRMEESQSPAAQWGVSASAQKSEMTLRQRMEAQEAERNARTNAIEERHAADGHAIEGRQVLSLGDRRVGRMLPSGSAAIQVARRHRLLDLSNPASIIVAAEVLGKPIALRDPGSRL